MTEQTQAASSPAISEDVFNGEQPTFEEFSNFRTSGEVPARFKPAEPAASTTDDAPEQTADDPEIEPDSDPEEAQEQPPKGSGAEKRIKQLLAKVKELERNQAPPAKQDAHSDPSPAPAAATQTAAQGEPTPDDVNADGTPKFKTYEEYTRALARWEVRQELAQQAREQAAQEAQKALRVKLEEARSRYEDADDVIFPAAKTINDANIPQAVKEIFAGSDLYVELCYAVGSDPKELEKFVSLAQTNPRAALAKVFDYERGIREGLAEGGKKTREPEGGKAPEKRTQAPKPPSPVSAGSSRAFDVSDEGLSADEWARKRNAQLAKRGRL